MMKNILSRLTVGIAVLVFAIPANLQALTPAETRAQIATLMAQLTALPTHQSPSSKVSPRVIKLVMLDPKNATVYLATGLPKIAMTQAIKNATTLTVRVNAKVNAVGDKALSAKQKKVIVAKNDSLLKKYVPPGGGIVD